MNKPLSLLASVHTAVLLFGLGCASTEPISVKPENLELKNGLLYHKDQGQPFTGKVLDDWDNGIRAGEVPVKDGLILGEVIVYHENGKVLLKANFTKPTEATAKRGVDAEEIKIYYESGELYVTAKKLLVTANDAVIGDITLWYKSGMKQAEIVMAAKAKGKILAWYKKTGGEAIGHKYYWPRKDKREILG